MSVIADDTKLIEYIFIGKLVPLNEDFSFVFLYKFNRFKCADLKQLFRNSFILTTWHETEIQLSSSIIFLNPTWS